MEQLAAKELQRRSVLSFYAGSGEGAQDSCRRAQEKSSPEVLAVLFFLALIGCCAECIAISSAATSIAGQPCSAQEVEGLLHRPGNQAFAGNPDLGAPVATPPWEVHGSADRVRQGGGEEDPRQHRAHVAPCFRGLREDRGSENPQSGRQGHHFPSPDEVAHRVRNSGYERSLFFKAWSVLTDLTRKDFVLLSQHIPIDIIHVSAPRRHW